MLCPIEGAVHWRGRPAWRRSGTRAPARAPGWHVRCFPRPVEAGAIHREDSHEAHSARARSLLPRRGVGRRAVPRVAGSAERSEEHTSELQSPCNLVCRLLLEKKKKKNKTE